MEFGDSGIICIKVNKDKDKGYWEINNEVKKAYFRDRGMLPPEDQDIQDFSSECETIDDFLTKHTNISYVKTIIPDRKIIFATSPFCDWSRQKTSDDGIVVTVYCQNPAKIKVGSGDNLKLFCEEHANFDVPKMSSTSSVST